jgi:polysaccharide biosynthesis transport protein
MTLRQFLLILLARRRIVLFALFGTVAASLLISYLLPPTYTATTSVVIDVKSPDPIAGMVLPGMIAPGYMATQVDIISSDRVAQRVVKLLKLDQSPAAQEQWKDATEGKGDITVWLGSVLQKKLEVKPSRESNVITIHYKAADPEFAAYVANGFAQAYIDTTIELKIEPARQYASVFDRQAKQARDRLEAAKAKLSEFQREKGIIATDDRLNFETQRLSELQSQLVLAESQGADAQSKRASRGGDTVQEVMQSPVVSSLKTSIAILESKLDEMSGNLGKNHPQYKRTAAELASLRSQMQAEIQKISSSISTSGRVSRSKQAELEGAIKSHKQQILNLKKERDEVSLLQQDADSAQRAYDAINQRYNQSSLEGAATQSNVTVLTQAAPPIDTSSPKMLLNAILAVFLGAVVGVGAALAAELADRRVRSADDLQLALDLPVLAELTKPKRCPESIADRWRARSLAVGSSTS